MVDPAAELFAHHTPRLRALARTLVACEQTADDLVAEAWLAAVRQPPRDGSRLGNWLAVLIRNLARRRARAEARRRRREVLVAKPDAAPDDGANGERFAAFARLVAAVDTLEEHERHVIVLRFFEELEATEIASRLRVPLATVRTRLRRGLERLRARLDRDFGARSAWVLLFQPLLDPWTVASATAGASAVAAAGTTGAAGTVLAMKIQGSHIAWASVVLVLLGAVGFALAVPPAGEPPAPTPEPIAERAVSRIAASEPLAATVSEDFAATRSPERAAAVSDVDEILTGRAVLHADRSAVAGARLCIRVFEQLSEVPLAETVVRTDDSGAFSFAVPRALVAGRVATTSLDPHLACTDTERLLALGRAHGVLVELTRLDGVIRGVVRDERGRGVGNAKVADNRNATRTDAEGRYELRYRVGARQVALRVAAPGFAGRREVVPCSSGQVEAERNIVLCRGVRIAGHITDTDGQPVAGARVGVMSMFLDTTLSAADGSYEIPFVDPAERTTLVSVRSRGHLDAHRTVEHGGKDATADFVLERGIELIGRVVDPASAPVRGAAIYVRTENLNNRDADAITDGDGNFVVRGVDRSWGHLAVEAPGFAIRQQPVDVPADATRVDLGAISLVPGREVSGVVRDRAGHPLLGVYVFGTYGPRADDRTDMHRAMGLLTTTDTTGVFRLVDMPSSLSLTFVCEDHVRRELDEVSDAVAVVLDRRAGIAGTVVDRVTRQPIRDFRIRFHEPGAERERRITSWWAVWSDGLPFQDRDGHWDTGDEEFEPDHWLGISVLADGYAPSPVVDVLTRDDPRPDQVVVELSRGARVEGVVVDENGIAVSDARVILCSTGVPVPPLVRDVEAPLGAREATTSNNGAFSFDHVTAGEATLVVFAATATPATATVPVPESGSVAATVRVAAGAIVRGRAVDEHGKAIVGARIELSSAHEPGQRVAAVATDANGAFAFEHVPEGKHWLRRAVPLGGQHDSVFYAAQRAVSVPPTGVRECDLDEHEGTGVLQGQVAAADGEFVVVRRTGGDDGALLRITPVANGAFRVDGLSPGPYEVSVGGARIGVDVPASGAVVDLRR